MDLLFQEAGKMDFTSCRKNKLIKEIKIDHNLVSALIQSSAKKLKSQDMLKLSDDTASSKITLIYDSVRELLEALAVSNGYKIYNHECYTSFLKEILKESNLGQNFDNFRKIRNDINYYGKLVSMEESEFIINQMKEFLKTLKLKFFDAK